MRKEPLPTGHIYHRFSVAESLKVISCKCGASFEGSPVYARIFHGSQAIAISSTINRGPPSPPTVSSSRSILQLSAKVLGHYHHHHHHLALNKKASPTDYYLFHIHVSGKRASMQGQQGVALHRRVTIK